MSNDTADRIAIRQLIDRYSDAVTRRDFTCVGGLFTEDAVWRVGAPFNMELHGPAIAQTLGAALANHELMLQMAMNSVIEIETADRATARTTMCEMVRDAQGGFTQYGFYEDVITKTGDVWRFQSRFFRPLFQETAAPQGNAFPVNS